MEKQVIFADSKLFAGWPANAGIWNWDEEILVAFHVGTYTAENLGHKISGPIRTCVARSRDGGCSWQLEPDNPLDAVSKGEVIPLPEDGIHFAHPDFALKVGSASVEIRNKTYVITYDRGHTWKGPYLLPDGDEKMTARTDYIIEGDHSCTLLLSRHEERIPCRAHPDRLFSVRTDDGGLSWSFLGYVADRRARSALSNTVHMSDGRMITSVSRRKDAGVRKTEGQNHWIELCESFDRGVTWKPITRIFTPYSIRSQQSNPSALGRLPDGRLLLIYALRSENPCLLARVSCDGGHTWGEDIVLDDDIISEDFGYPVMAVMPFGKVVIVYFCAASDNSVQHIRSIRFSGDEIQNT